MEGEIELKVVNLKGIEENVTCYMSNEFASQTETWGE
eukprot:CAMPEP_0170548898 /NCGR_PEP_ID=MMETSP0211-20121228/7068_1 /TAXON_ID=311385 /ORGANISM="Pseudokeronopsis sp., Strain OXSARD2" /LENGTH=36 /DNA_ID= /DNA_START= /DNA_END= /DNA_ORIENTATION=